MYFFRTDRVPDFGQDLNKAYLSSFFANFLVHISVKLYSGVLFKLLNEKYIYVYIFLMFQLTIKPIQKRTLVLTLIRLKTT